MKGATNVQTREGTSHVAILRQWNKDGHAIVQAAFTVHFNSKATAQTIRELLGLHSKIKEEYPRRQEARGRTIGFAASALEDDEFRPDVSEPLLAGLSFDSLKADGQILRSITAHENQLSIMRADYDHRDKTWAEVREIFDLMLPALIERSDAVAFQLQYRDRFVREGDRNEFRADKLFRTGSRMLVPNIFEVEDLWHSYHGYFEYPDQPHKHQLLNLAEVQVIPPENVGLDQEPWLLVEVRLNHRAFHGWDRAGGRPNPIQTVEEILGADDAVGLIDAYMEELHNKDKWLLARLINDEMCDRINLEKPE